MGLLEYLMQHLHDEMSDEIEEAKKLKKGRSEYENIHTAWSLNREAIWHADIYEIREGGQVRCGAP